LAKKYNERMVDALPLPMIQYIGRELITGVKIMQETGILHADIKPENIFWLDGTLKIGDLGSAISFKEEWKVPLGEHSYMVPELLRELQWKSIQYKFSVHDYCTNVDFSKGAYKYLTNANFDFYLRARPKMLVTKKSLRYLSNVDMWSTCITLLQLLDKNTVNNVLQLYAATDITKFISANTKDVHLVSFLKKCLHPAVKKRPSPHLALMHKFFQEKIALGCEEKMCANTRKCLKQPTETQYCKCGLKYKGPFCEHNNNEIIPDVIEEYTVKRPTFAYSVNYDLQSESIQSDEVLPENFEEEQEKKLG